MLPKDFAGRAVSTADRVLAFCGDCPFFEVHPLGGGGECHKGHDCRARAAAEECPDRRGSVRSKGPLFDLSE